MSILIGSQGNGGRTAIAYGKTPNSKPTIKPLPPYATTRPTPDSVITEVKENSAMDNEERTITGEPPEREPEVYDDEAGFTWLVFPSGNRVPYYD